MSEVDKLYNFMYIWSTNVGSARAAYVGKLRGPKYLPFAMVYVDGY
jgi:hypothetical protein